jgi:hypothetical protein
MGRFFLSMLSIVLIINICIVLQADFVSKMLCVCYPENLKENSSIILLFVLNHCHKSLNQYMVFSYHI